MSNRYLNLDAAQSLFLDRQLEYIKTQVYPVLYPELKGRQYLPVDSSAGDGVTSVVTRQEDMFGEAKIITDYGADLPRADAKMEETSQKVRDVGVSFGYNVREIAAAARLGMNLSEAKARSARKAAELKLDNIAALGDSASGLNGFINHSAITPVNAPNGGWTSASPDEIVADVNDGVSDIRDTTKGIHSPTTLLLPESKYTLIAQTRMTDLNVTILQFILSTNPFLKEILPWYKLAGQGESATDRMIFYDRSPDVVELCIPVEFQIMEPQARGLEFVVPTRLVTGGVLLHRPGAVAYRDNI